MRVQIAIAFVTAVTAAIAPTDGVRAGTTLTLSHFSSDRTPPEDLDGRLEFTVAGESLILTIVNDTPLDVGFDIDAIFFNTSVDVAGLILEPTVDGWLLHPDQRADGFGTYDWALVSDHGHDPFEISPQTSRIFHFDISGVAPFSASDFTTEFSRIPPGDTPALAAVKFVNGPHDDSAFGAVVPEPATLALGLAGLGVLACLPRRRKGHRNLSQ